MGEAPAHFIVLSRCKHLLNQLTIMTRRCAQQAARATNKQRSTPAPNAYNLQRPFINKQDFNVGVSRVFRLPVAVQLDGLKHRSPAPNQYDVREWRK